MTFEQWITGQRERGQVPLVLPMNYSHAKHLMLEWPQSASGAR